LEQIFLFSFFLLYEKNIIFHIASKLPGDRVGVQAVVAAALHKFSSLAGSVVGKRSQE